MLFHLVTNHLVRYTFIGSESGLASALDFRTGQILNRWRAHDSAILKIDAVDNFLVTSSTDKTVCKWNMDGVEPTLSLKLKGYSEPAANFAGMGGSLLTASGSKVAIISLQQEVCLTASHHTYDPLTSSQTGMMQVNPTKLQNTKSDRITAMKALSYHRFFVLGTEGSYITPFLSLLSYTKM